MGELIVSEVGVGFWEWKGGSCCNIGKPPHFGGGRPCCHTPNPMLWMRSMSCSSCPWHLENVEAMGRPLMTCSFSCLWKAFQTDGCWALLGAAAPSDTFEGAQQRWVMCWLSRGFHWNGSRIYKCRTHNNYKSLSMVRAKSRWNIGPREIGGSSSCSPIWRR